jgi:hypothetical protein
VNNQGVQNGFRGAIIFGSIRKFIRSELKPNVEATSTFSTLMLIISSAKQRKKEHAHPSAKTL